MKLTKEEVQAVLGDWAEKLKEEQEALEVAHSMVRDAWSAVEANPGSEKALWELEVALRGEANAHDQLFSSEGMLSMVLVEARSPRERPKVQDYPVELQEIAALEKGWNGEESQSFTPIALRAAKKFLEETKGVVSGVVATPFSDGSMDLNWKAGELFCQLTVMPGGDLDYSEWSDSYSKHIFPERPFLIELFKSGNVGVPR